MTMDDVLEEGDGNDKEVATDTAEGEIEQQVVKGLSVCCSLMLVLQDTWSLRVRRRLCWTMVL